LAWRAAHRPPPLPADVGELSRRASAATHHLLYALMVLVPALGVVAYVWHGRLFDYGLFQLNFGVPSDKAIFHPAEKIHQYLAYSLFALIGLHVAGALWHQYFRRDGVLLRMLPGAAR
jgi:cytochrome b561